MVIGLTGSTGFLGRHVLREIELRGHEAVGFSRNPMARVTGTREVRPWSTGVAPDVSGCEAVIHLAGESVLGLWTSAKRRSIRESRVAGTRQLVEALRDRAGGAVTPALVCGSAIGYYGDRGDQRLSESEAPGRGFLAEVTQAWEAEAMRASEYGVRVVRGRIGVVMGADGGAWPLLRRVFGLGVGGRLGSGRQWMSWVHVRDVAALLVTAATDSRCQGPMNLVSPEPVTNSEFTRAVARALHRPAIFPVPSVALRLLLRDQAGILLDSQRVVPQAAEAIGCQFAFPSLDGALDELVRAPNKNKTGGP
ncbi:MAG: TIGR01777 family oxidoreductase [Verrucomicrobiales bacterium]